MVYENVVPAVFGSRPNRFIAQVELEGEPVTCHVKNTGRCRELLVPGAVVYLQKAANPGRSTGYDLIAVRKGERLINMDSQAPNKVFAEWLRSGGISGITLLRPETRYGDSRFDFYVEAGDRKIFAEVKGVTLEEDGVVLFPDAPTQRGVRHLAGLCGCVRDGYEAMIVFVVQMRDVRRFVPNNKTHPAFGDALKAARDCGVKIAAFDCQVAPDSISAGEPVQVVL